MWGWDICFYNSRVVLLNMTHQLKLCNIKVNHFTICWRQRGWLWPCSGLSFQDCVVGDDSILMCCGFTSVVLLSSQICWWVRLKWSFLGYLLKAVCCRLMSSHLWSHIDLTPWNAGGTDLNCFPTLHWTNAMRWTGSAVWSSFNILRRKNNFWQSSESNHQTL